MGFLAGILGKVLGFIYGIIPNYGIAIIVFTIFIKTLLLPLSLKQLKSSKAMAIIGPKTQELQRKYKDNRDVLNQKIMELYKEYNYNPFAGCLPMILSLVVLVGFYTALRLPEIYVFSNPETLKEATHQVFLWIPNLSLPDFLSNVLPNADFAKNLPGLMPIISAVLTYFTMTLTPQPNAPAQTDPNAPPQPGGNMMKVFKFMMPAMILFYGTKLSGGLVLYWTVSNIYGIGQQLVFNNIRKMEEMAN